MKIDHFLLFLPVLGPFPQVFGQVNEWLVLELQEMRKVSYVVSCPLDLNLL